MIWPNFFWAILEEDFNLDVDELEHQDEMEAPLWRPFFFMLLITCFGFSVDKIYQ